MLVLLHFFKLGYSPFTLAFLFLLYEFAGIVANLAGGWLATRFGIPRMLAVGQALQIAGLAMLSALDPGWTAAASVAWVVAAQGIAGLAKDFTKTASKIGDQGHVGRRLGPALQVGGVVHRLEERHEGHRLLRRRPAARGHGLQAGAVADGRRDRRHLPGWPCAAAAPARQGEGVEDSARILRQVARRQPARRGARLPVRRARRLVRRRTAGVPLRSGLALRRGRRLPRRLDDRLRRDPGGRTCAGRAQPPMASAAKCPTRGCGPAC